MVLDAVGTSSYGAGNRQLAYGSSTQTFDDNGNRLTQTDPSGTITSTRDARNRLAGLTGPSLAAGFAYDGLGRHAQKTIGSTTTAFRYDGLDVVRESSGGADVAYLRTLGIDEAVARTDAMYTRSRSLGDGCSDNRSNRDSGRQESLRLRNTTRPRARHRIAVTLGRVVGFSRG